MQPPSTISCINGAKSGSHCICGYPRETVPLLEGDGWECVIKNCGHGAFNRTANLCQCDPGWRVAGMTDMMNLLKDRCTQFMCQSDEQCVQKLGIQTATCPQQGWNCDCGLRWAMYRTDEAQCMFPWYVVIFRLIAVFEVLMECIWKGAAVLAMILLPLGKNVIGVADRCVWRLLHDDFAWSIFAVKVGLWLYFFVFVVYMSLGAMVVSLYLFVAILAIVVVGVVIAASGCTNQQDNLPCTDNCGEGCCECEGGCCECGPSDTCCFCFGAESSECCQCLQWSCCPRAYWYSDGLTPVEVLLLPDMHPCSCFDPIPQRGIEWTGECSRRRCCGCCISSMLGIPCFRLLVPLFPQVPENMLGGLVGLMAGTHALRNSYDPDSRVVECLSNPCWSLTHRSERWRESVRQWLYEIDPMEVERRTGLPLAEPQREEHSEFERTNYGGVVVESEDDTFTEDDGIFNFDDYKANSCWICQQARPEWDLWVSCRHVFCSQCSSEMLRRRMPCPFCRVRSGRVLRRGMLEKDSSSSGSGSESDSSEPNTVPLAPAARQISMASA